MDGLPLHIPFNLSDARLAGISRGHVRSMVASGVLREVVRGAYVSADEPDGPGLRAAALSRVAPPHTVVCRRTAAWLHGVDVMAFGANLEVPPTDLLVPAGVAAPRRPHVNGYSANLRDHEVEEVDGILVTSTVRTALDLARWLPLIDGVAAVDAMLYGGVVDLDDLRDELRLFKGYRNKLRAERVLALADGRAESPQESRLRVRLVVYAELPRPEAQLVVQVGNREFRLDLGYAKWRVGVEYDGVEYHSEPGDVAHDEWRRRRLAELGWTIHVARSADVLRDWMAFTAQVRQSIRRAGWQPKPS